MWVSLDGQAGEAISLRVPTKGGYALQPENIAVIVNTDNQDSVKAGEYYVQARHIPVANLIRVSIPSSPKKLSAQYFTQFKQEVDAQLEAKHQVIVMMWTAPYAVECNSITTAMTMGFDPEQCANTCAPAKHPNRYFNSSSLQPYGDFGYRLSMLLPVQSFDQAKALIDRGIASDYSAPAATAYFLNTSDKNRSSRAMFFPPSGRVAQRFLEIKNLKADTIRDAQDVMIYHTGLVTVPDLDTLKFYPGALADHLTSTGGDLLGTGQMSSLRWLDAGATASYGTVSEPCNYWQKFPNSAVLLKHYLMGASAIEAYWKSVAWPVQGVFIGEPLASPYKR
ncbi:TIGR03790 family protein [Methylobacillus gramineus]|uniref:TIGR03790 family protein n=1 Tax=Methylobacillus gramineus TaxID=755169 RepID=UPI001CFF91F6|nr:TIGR03790 family protein [Methylobacillus gramineus]MCB5183710.1 TIGR03790 family protein [Methylobacillus gramineus]